EKRGVWQEFGASGEPWRAVTYVEGLEDGPAPAACARVDGDWVADGEKRVLGCQVCRVKPDDTIVKVGVGRWTFWHPNGAIEKQGDLVEGKQQGTWSFFYDNGQKMLAGDFRGGEEEGRWTGCYREGQPRFRGAYLDGAPVGEWTSFYPDGKPLSVGRYDRGKKAGRWTYYGKSGKTDEVEYK